MIRVIAALAVASSMILAPVQGFAQNVNRSTNVVGSPPPQWGAPRVISVERGKPVAQKPLRNVCRESPCPSYDRSCPGGKKRYCVLVRD